MILYPAIDIRHGRCVRLLQGKDEHVTEYGQDPVAVAESWVEKGAKRLHVVDLDGAFTGTPQNTEIVREIIRRTGIPIQIGGGIRSLESAEAWLDAGAHRIVLGTSAVKHPELVSQLAEKFGEKIVVSLDCWQGMICVDGWVENSDLEAVAFANRLYEMGIRTIVYTDISRDGTLEGPNLEELINIQAKTSMNIIASGGVSSEADVRALAGIGVYGVIVGKALYEGKVTLDQLKEFL